MNARKGIDITPDGEVEGIIAQLEMAGEDVIYVASPEDIPLHEFTKDPYGTPTKGYHNSTHYFGYDGCIVRTENYVTAEVKYYVLPAGFRVLDARTERKWLRQLPSSGFGTEVDIAVASGRIALREATLVIPQELESVDDMVVHLALNDETVLDGSYDETSPLIDWLRPNQRAPQSYGRQDKNVIGWPVEHGLRARTHFRAPDESGTIYEKVHFPSGRKSFVVGTYPHQR